MATISKSGIVSNQTIQAAHITNIIDALDGTTETNIVAAGGFTGSLQGNVTGSVTGDFTGTLKKLTGTNISASTYVSSLYAGKFYAVNASSGTVTLTLDYNAAGAEFEFAALNLTNPIQFAAGAGVTIYSEDSNLKLNKVGSAAFVKYTDYNTCFLIGSLKA